MSTLSPWKWFNKLDTMFVGVGVGLVVGGMVNVLSLAGQTLLLHCVWGSLRKSTHDS